MYLVITVSINGNELKNHHFEQQTVLIGRDVDSDIRLDNVGVSRNHAKIVREGELLQVVDLASGNGTFVNGNRVEQAAIIADDTVGIGKFTLTAKLTEARPVTAVAQPSGPDADDSHINSATVFLRPHETQKILQQGQAVGQTSAKVSPSAAAPATPPSSKRVLVAGALLGLFFGWLFWY